MLDEEGRRKGEGRKKVTENVGNGEWGKGGVSSVVDCLLGRGIEG